MTKSKFELKTFSSDTMLNFHLSKKLKLIERNKFNHIINTLIILFNKYYRDVTDPISSALKNNKCECSLDVKTSELLVIAQFC
jgi:hypothetical protein